jgi:hypothetical protein
MAMDRKAFRQMLLAHLLGERARDLDATMAPVSAHPVWLVPNYRLEGRETVRAYYAKALVAMREGWMDECIQALDDPQVTHRGEAQCLIEYSDAYPMHHGWVMVVHFDDGIRSENTYPRPDHGLQVAMGADFEALPGVTRLI